ncbi:MAG: hypothetical protein HOB02_08205 [Proteobacteria bacterium]|jgi:hypothetical protein|nr:hypothetical protein [Pseudomonadota bacterium]
MDKNQQVQLQYSTTLEELPNEMRRLVNKSFETLQEDATQSLKKLLHREDKLLLSLNSLHDIQQCKESLARVSAGLTDVESIINGFIKINLDASSREVSKERAEEETSITPDSPEPQHPENSMSPFLPENMPNGFPDRVASARGELDEKLKEFREQIKQYEKSAKAHKEDS